MRRSAWIFFASIFLPSLGLAWLAVHSVRDQQVVLEHQQAIICQNITDALAKSIQSQMDQVRGDFVKTTQRLLGESTSPQELAQDFNRKLREAWPPAEIGFAVNLDGEIYSPRPYDSPEAKTFRDENDRFLSNRENVEVYSSNSIFTNQNASLGQNAAAQFTLKIPVQAANSIADKAKAQAMYVLDSIARQKNVSAQSEPSKDEESSAELQSAVAGSLTKNAESNQNSPPPPASMADSERADSRVENVPTSAHAPAQSDQSTSGATPTATAMPAAAPAPMTLPSSAV